jgi:hypothetical protein
MRHENLFVYTLNACEYGSELERFLGRAAKERHSSGYVPENVMSSIPKDTKIAALMYMSRD